MEFSKNMLNTILKKKKRPTAFDFHFAGPL